MTMAPLRLCRRRAPALFGGVLLCVPRAGVGSVAAFPADPPPRVPPSARAERRIDGDGVQFSTVPSRTATRYGTTDEDFEAWFASRLASEPLRDVYPRIFDGAASAVSSWRRRYRGNPSLWRRVFHADRIVKELVEAAPIVDAAARIIESDPGGKRYTVVDLASGRGYLSMFLSEMLPPDRVERIILVDKAWPLCGAPEPLPHQMSWDHIYANRTVLIDDGSVRGEGTYFETWPIPLHTSKQDLKSKCTKRQMKKHIFDHAEGPVIVLAVHLCGTLSLRAVDMFNEHANVRFLGLKPCCLPPMLHADRDEVFEIGAHQFEARDVCAAGRFRKNRWYGPPRWHLER